MRFNTVSILILATLLLSGCTGIVTESQGNSPILPIATNNYYTQVLTETADQTTTKSLTQTETPEPTIQNYEPHPLQIEVMRQQAYPGSQITFERTLSTSGLYSQYVVSYQSDGLKIYALMTIPNGTAPESGWPAIVFNHGYIAPSEYRTTERYVSYVDAIASSGYIVLKPDFRGHDNSDGSEVVGGGYGDPGYTADVLNAMASLQQYEAVDHDRIGMWGHSMGGQVTLRAMVVSKDIKAGVIWGGVVAPYPEIIERWDFSRNAGMFSFLEGVIPQNSSGRWIHNFSNWVEAFTAEYGEPDENPDFWVTISPNSYLMDLSGPIQLHHSTTDEMVPLAWSEILVEELQESNMLYEFNTYAGDNHNISANFNPAMRETIAFFDRYVKGQ